jgi:hypothetical protein
VCERGEILSGSDPLSRASIENEPTKDAPATRMSVMEERRRTTLMSVMEEVWCIAVMYPNQHMTEGETPRHLESAKCYGG